MLSYLSIKTILSALAALTLLVNPATAAAATPPPPSSGNLEERAWLSNIDVAQACREQYGSSWVAVVIGNSCGGWQCRSGGASGGVNMLAYCNVRFGGDAYASCGGGTVWDWQCHSR